MDAPANHHVMDSEAISPERWQLIKEIYHSALNCEPGERAVFIAAACGDDDSLREEVASLIASHKRAQGFIEMSAFEVASRVLTDRRDEEASGRRIGHYEVVREIGRGGMGTVYLAARADDEFQKRVAIKLIKRGMDTDFILRRFRNERQILANLDHPNIARLIDGGTTEDGLPYFVMEYIEGVPINVYCAKHELHILKRLKLFRTVCAAVQFAHQNLVIHRDIKPSNILVTSDGTPKLLDFGIAKLLDPASASETEVTQTILSVMTPEYASPEQVRGQSVTTASDIYSLGVILYELLTGHRLYIFRNRAPEEIAEVICVQEPERPSVAVSSVQEEVREDGGPDKLRRLLRGDLDNIVLMAMRKEPQRRYATVEQFSEDIRRHMEGLPVSARKDTFGYRTQKFIRRNRVGVAAAAIVAVAMLGGMAATLWQARVARAERARAERRFNDVRLLANSFMFEFHDAIANLQGATPARKLVVARALNYLDSLAQESGNDPSLQRELATAYMKVGDVQGKPYRSNLGDTAGALESYRKAVIIFEALSRSDPTNAETRRGLSIAYENIGNIQTRLGDGNEAVERQRKALAIREALLKDDPTNVDYRRQLAAGYIHLGDAMVASGESSNNVEHMRVTLDIYRKSLPVREQLYATDPKNASDGRDLAQTYQRIGNVLFQIGRVTDDIETKRLALANHRASLAVRESLVAANPTSAQARRDLADEYIMKAPSQMVLGDAAGALADCHKALVIFESLLAADPMNAEARHDLGYAHYMIGLVLEVKLGDIAGAVESYRKSLQIFEAMVASDPANTENHADLVRVRERLGEILGKVGNTAGSIEH